MVGAGTDAGSGAGRIGVEATASGVKSSSVMDGPKIRSSSGVRSSGPYCTVSGSKNLLLLELPVLSPKDPRLLELLLEYDILGRSSPGVSAS